MLTVILSYLSNARCVVSCCIYCGILGGAIQYHGHSPYPALVMDAPMASVSLRLGVEVSRVQSP